MPPLRGSCPSEVWAQVSRYPGFLREEGNLDFHETFPIFKCGKLIQKV